MQAAEISMADETKGPGGISNKGDTDVPQTPQPQTAGEPEVHILEEHVTHAATRPPGPTQNAPASPPVPKSSVPPAVPPAPKTPPVQRPPLAPVSEGPRAQPPQAPGVISAPPQEGAMGDDIAKILADVKLPERHAPLLSGEKRTIREPKKFDTSILGSALNEETKAESAATAQTEVPAHPAPVPSLVTAKSAEKHPSSVVAVHTLKNDLQDVVHDQKISVVRAVSLEEDRRGRKTGERIETPASTQRSKRVFGIIFSVLILCGLGIAALFGVLYIMNQKGNTPQVDTGPSLLFAEQSVLLSLDAQSPSDLKRTLETARTAGGGTLGSITRIIPVVAATSSDGAIQNRPATFREFMGALGAHPPEDFLRAVGTDFFLGLHTVDKNAPIIILPVSAYDRAFAAMLAWEGSLNADLEPLFTPVPTLTTDKDGLPVKRTYEDLVMRNYDVRALKDDAGTIELYYSFPTQHILVIAESPYSFPEILSRLQAGRRL